MLHNVLFLIEIFFTPSFYVLVVSALCALYITRGMRWSTGEMRDDTVPPRAAHSYFLQKYHFHKLDSGTSNI
jgi:hypothetical protein